MASHIMNCLSYLCSPIQLKLVMRQLLLFCQVLSVTRVLWWVPRCTSHCHIIDSFDALSTCRSWPKQVQLSAVTPTFTLRSFVGLGSDLTEKAIPCVCEISFRKDDSTSISHGPFTVHVVMPRTRTKGWCLVSPVYSVFLSSASTWFNSHDAIMLVHS